MNDDELRKRLEVEWWITRGANPDWEMTLEEFLLSRGVEPKERPEEEG